jgi:hypothetical protein
MDPYESEIRRLQALYDEVPDDAPLEMDDESEEESGNNLDTVEESIHETDTEQEPKMIIICKTQKLLRLVLEVFQELYYLRKDATKWRKHTPPTNIRTVRHNIVTHLPGEARNAADPYQSWMVLFGNIITVLVENTNLYIQKIAVNFKDQ